MDKKTHKIEHVIFDCECQCELYRSESLDELDEMIDLIGGGNYNVYPCPDGYTIIKVEPRDFGDRELCITIECNK